MNLNLFFYKFPDRFDIHRDTIIQTEDSRKMGANFLYHLDLNNHEECLRVCCETDKCDVFVFEDKFKGTCFLFQCGPPDDFRCQFTAHANYTIAVLSPVQQEQQFRPQPFKPQATPSPQQNTYAIHLSQHEKELVDLKGSKESVVVSKQLEKKDVTSTTIPPLGIPMSDSGTGNDCGRFQFKCHSGECIAIYNACDGIPQCEDGSDEGAEVSDLALENVVVLLVCFLIFLVSRPKTSLLWDTETQTRRFFHLHKTSESIWKSDGLQLKSGNGGQLCTGKRKYKCG